MSELQAVLPQAPIEPGRLVKRRLRREKISRGKSYAGSFGELPGPLNIDDPLAILVDKVRRRGGGGIEILDSLV